MSASEHMRNRLLKICRIALLSPNHSIILIKIELIQNKFKISKKKRKRNIYFYFREKVGKEELRAFLLTLLAPKWTEPRSTAKKPRQPNWRADHRQGPFLKTPQLEKGNSFPPKDYVLILFCIFKFPVFHKRYSP